jgi:hypothetical protein
MKDDLEALCFDCIHEAWRGRHPDRATTEEAARLYYLYRAVHLHHVIRVLYPDQEIPPMRRREIAE